MGVVCGGSRWQIIASAQLSEAMPALAAAVTLNLVSMIEYSAIAGTIGAAASATWPWCTAISASTTTS